MSQQIGCGIDVVELPRFRHVAQRGGAAFMKRVFTAREVAYAQARPRTKWLHLAARFAAKEAVIKALSQLNSHRTPAMRQIEICNDLKGRPSVRVHPAGRKAAVIHISLSHVNSVAVATAIAIRRARSK